MNSRTTELIDYELNKSNTLLDNYNHDIKPKLHSIAFDIVDNPSQANINLYTANFNASIHSKELIKLINESRESLYYLYRLQSCNSSFERELQAIENILVHSLQKAR